MADALEDMQDLVSGTVTVARASWRLSFPSRSSTPTWGEIAWTQFTREVRTGAVTDQNVLDEIVSIPNENFRRLPVNYTDLEQAGNGLRQVGQAGLNLAPFIFQISGKAIEDQNPELGYNLQSVGSTLDGTLNLWQSLKQIQQGTAWLNKVLCSPFGKPLIVIQGLIGAWDYAAGAHRLVFDPTIVPGASQHAWIERVGVATQAIGGAFLVGGAIAALLPGGLPVAAVLLTAGTMFEGAGMIMQNWNWITEQANRLFGHP